MAHIYIALTIIFTVYGQLVLRWQMVKVGTMPTELGQKIVFLLSQLGNLWILSGFASAFLAAMAWMAAVNRFELSYAYPFMGLAFILVMFFSVLFLGESLTWQRSMGTMLIVAGLFLITR